MTLSERFWSKVKQTKSNDCWEWVAGKTKAGYGRIRVSGRQEGAHRVARLLTYGKIPDGLCVLHTCDNPACVNPIHLWLGTRGDNMKDMVQKGRRRHRRGGKNPNAAVSDAIARRIRLMAAKRILSQRIIGEQFGVSQQCVSRILTGRTYQDAE